MTGWDSEVADGSAIGVALGDGATMDGSAIDGGGGGAAGVVVGRTATPSGGLLDAPRPSTLVFGAGVELGGGDVECRGAGVVGVGFGVGAGFGGGTTTICAVLFTANGVLGFPL